MIYIISTILFFSIIANIIFFSFCKYMLEDNGDLKDENEKLKNENKDLKWEFKKQVPNFEVIEVQQTKPILFKKSYDWTVDVDDPKTTQDFKQYILFQVSEQLEIHSIKNPSSMKTDFYAKLNIPT